MPVSIKLADEIFKIEMWHIISLLFSVAVNYYIYLNARKSPLLYTYLSTQAMLIIWIVAKIFKTVAPTIEQRWFFIVLQYFGASFLGPCLLLFAYAYTKRKLPKLSQIFLLYLPALYCFSIVASNPIHFQFYSNLTFYSDSFGKLFYVNMAIAYIYLFISIYLLSRGFLKMFGSEKKRAYLFSGAIIIPFVMNIFYVFRLFKLFFGHTPLFDYTPIATNVSLVFFALAAMKYRFLDILPMARRQIFDGLSDAVVVCDENLKICDFNQKAISIFPNIKYGEIFEISQDSIKIDEKVYKVLSNNDKNSNVFRFSDITAISSMLCEVQNKNDELSETKEKLEQMLTVKKNLITVKASNYILQELHDILGHATVLAISACEIEVINGAFHYEDTLFGIKKLLVESQSELRHALKSEENNYRRTSLIIAIDSLISNTTSSRIKVEQTVQGKPFEFDSETSQAILRLCQEAVTNSLKHSSSNEVHVVLRYNENDLEIFVMDNGEGCDEIICGKGLTGMQDRLKAVNGTISFTSDINCGFRIYAKVGRS